MIPRTSLKLDPAIPPNHTGWTPKKDDLSEEGFGYFRDTWLIRGVGIREAKGTIAIELTLVELAGRLAVDPDEFNLVAAALEDGSADGLPKRLLQQPTCAELEPHLGDGSPLGGLELGVAGLVYALSAGGCWPAASCRGHPTDHAWANHPVVYLAGDSHRVTVLQPMVEASGCGFNTDPGRPELLVIKAESVEEMMSLARLVVDACKAFVPRRTSRRPRQEGSDAQSSFDFGV